MGLGEWKIKLNNESEIFQAELRSLRKAMGIAWEFLLMSTLIFRFAGVRSGRIGTHKLLDLIQNWPLWARSIWVKAYVGILGNGDTDGRAKEANLFSLVKRELCLWTSPRGLMRSEKFARPTSFDSSKKT